jgi:hypothetical protein
MEFAAIQETADGGQIMRIDIGVRANTQFKLSEIPRSPHFILDYERHFGGTGLQLFVA